MIQTSPEEAIRDVKRRYFHSVDSKNWALFASVFKHDATKLRQ